MNRKPWWVLQDAGGDIVALCDNSGSVGGAAFVAAQWTYDAYGSVFSADHLTPHPFMHAGHKGLFFDRLDVGVADAVPGSGGGVGASQSPRLVPFAHAIIHNRNRAYNPQFGRFMQADPNASGMVVIIDLNRHGQNQRIDVDEIQIELRFIDGANLHQYLGSNSWVRTDPLGLFLSSGLPDPSDFITGVLESLVTEYSVNLEWDVDWAMDWEAPDDAHSRVDNRWITLAIGQGFYDAFEIGIGDYTFNPLDAFASAASRRDTFKRPTNVRRGGGKQGEFSNGWTYRIDTNKVRKEEGRFHIHISDAGGSEVAKVTGKGAWVSHRGKKLLKPSEVPTIVRVQVNRLVRWTKSEFRGEEP